VRDFPFGDSDRKSARESFEATIKEKKEKRNTRKIKLEQILLYKVISWSSRDGRETET